MVAADFTLYSNPINRALYRPLQPALPGSVPLPMLPPSSTLSHQASGKVAVSAVSADTRPVIWITTAVAI